jgi:hypothetical protein
MLESQTLLFLSYRISDILFYSIQWKSITTVLRSILKVASVTISLNLQSLNALSNERKYVLFIIYVYYISIY